MREHYGFSEEQFSALQKNGVTIKHLFNSVKLFDPHGSNAELSNATALFYYVDQKGDFNKSPSFPHRKIARELFSNLGIKNKIAVAEYIDWAEHDFNPEWEGE